MTKGLIKKGKKAAHNAISISLIVTAVIVFVKLNMSRTEGKLTLLFLTTSPYVFLYIINFFVSEKRAIRSIWLLSYTNCVIGSVSYLILFPSGPMLAGEGASMAALIFFFVTFFQLLLISVFAIVFALKKNNKSRKFFL